MAQLEPMAVIPSVSAQPASFGRWAPTPCRRGFACPYFRRRCCFFGHSPEDVAAESEVERDHLTPCRDDAATALDVLMERVTRLERVVEQIVGVPLPQIMKEIVDGMQHIPEERVQNFVTEQIGSVPVPWIIEHFGRSILALLFGAHPRTNRGSDFFFRGASDHGENLRFRSPCASGADPRTNCGADFSGASDHGENRRSYSARALGARAESCRGADCGCASTPDQGGYRRMYAARPTGARFAAVEKTGLLGLAKKTRFTAEHWEGQVHRESVHCEDASSSW